MAANGPEEFSGSHPVFRDAVWNFQHGGPHWLVSVTAQSEKVGQEGLDPCLDNRLSAAGDIAVMRALGARRDVVMSIILSESLLIALIGGGVGWLAGHLIGLLASPAVEYRTGIQMGLLTSVTLPELILIPGLILLATLAGLIPALSAYRTDVSRNLSS